MSRYNGINLCISSINFKPYFIKREMNLNDFFNVCRDIGVDAVELCDKTIQSTDEEYLRNLKELLKIQQMRLPVIDIRNDFSVSDSGKRNEAMDHVIKWMRVASKPLPVVKTSFWLN